MGVSKKKIRKQTKVSNDELIEQQEKINVNKRKVSTAKSIAGDSLFTENTKKSGLREQRKKLKADRFKAIEQNTTSQVDTKLVKREVIKAQRREEAGIVLKK